MRLHWHLVLVTRNGPALGPVADFDRSDFLIRWGSGCPSQTVRW